MEKTMAELAKCVALDFLDCPVTVDFTDEKGERCNVKNN